MSKIIEMRKALKSLITSVHAQNYFEEAPEDAAYPYIVVDFPNSNDDGTLEQFFIDVDGWDKPSGGLTNDLEDLMDKVDNVLHRKTIYSNGLCMTLYRENRTNLRDPDKRIRRRKYIYQARTF